MDPRMMYDIYLPYDEFIIMGFKSGDTREKGYGITTDHPNARYYADYFIVERIYDISRYSHSVSLGLQPV